MTIYFRWEKTMTGRWQPACYHDNPPMKPSREDELCMTSPVVLSDDLVSGDGTPIFGKITKRYPMPVSE